MTATTERQGPAPHPHPVGSGAAQRMHTMRMAKSLLTVLMVATALSFAPLPAHGAGPTSEPIIIVDPGHGGQDDGGRGVAGAIEKNVNLELSGLLADGLRGRYRVTLTRTSDVGLPPEERTGAANHANGQLLISIHTGAAFRPSVSGCRVYVHQSQGPVIATGANETATPWHRRQSIHRLESLRLAQLMASRLQAGTGDDIGVIKAPLAVLAGADMPAVMVEIGHITHPANEQQYKDPAFRVRVVQAMVWAINDFFSGRKAILSEDLKE